MTGVSGIGDDGGDSGPGQDGEAASGESGRPAAAVRTLRSRVARLGQRPSSSEARLGDPLRVVLDVRPLQEPERAPTTAVYLEQLLAAFEADPRGERFVVLLRLGRADPTVRFPGLPVDGRRWLPPTRLLRSSALTLDPFLLRGITVGAGPRLRRGDADERPIPTVFHIAGGAAPLASGLPVVATLLDLAPWELPNAYQASAASRFGQRVRARILRDAAAVIVGASATARSAHRLLHVPADRLHVVPLAAADAFRPNVRLATGETFTGTARRVRGAGGADVTGIQVLGPDPVMRDRLDRERGLLGLAERYFVFFGRYDARKDMATLMDALAALRAGRRPDRLAPDVPWPPRLLLVNASPDDRAALARAAAREGVGDLVTYAPFLEVQRLAALVAGARAAVLPAVSEATGLTAIESLAAGTPVIASAVGALPEIVGSAGILVEPRDPARLASALATAWADDDVHARLLRLARARAIGSRRTWADVARETRAVYAAAAAAGTEG